MPGWGFRSVHEFCHLGLPATPWGRHCILSILEARELRLRRGWALFRDIQSENYKTELSKLFSSCMVPSLIFFCHGNKLPEEEYLGRMEVYSIHSSAYQRRGWHWHVPGSGKDLTGAHVEEKIRQVNYKWRNRFEKRDRLGIVCLSSLALTRFP